MRKFPPRRCRASNSIRPAPTNAPRGPVSTLRSKRNAPPNRRLLTRNPRFVLHRLSSPAGAAVAYARTQLSYTDIVAPIDGKVTNRMVEDGEYVTIGQALLTLVLREVWVVANYKETQLTLMRPGQPVRLRVDAFPGETYSGHVDSIQAGSGSAFSLLPPENATGNYVKVVQRVPVKILFDNLPDKPLSPGMSVEPNVKVR